MEFKEPLDMTLRELIETVTEVGGAAVTFSVSGGGVPSAGVMVVVGEIAGPCMAAVEEIIGSDED